MNKKQKKEIKHIASIMIDSLEVPILHKELTKKTGNKHFTLTGEFVCYEDIPEEVPEFDLHFLVCGENEYSRYLVLIKHIK